MRIVLALIFAALLLAGRGVVAQQAAGEDGATAIVVIGVETAHPSGVNSIFSDVPTIRLVFTPIDMRTLDIDPRRPPFIVERAYCNPLALDRDDCPAGEGQTHYAAYQVPAGVYMLQSISVANSGLIDADEAVSDLFYPPGHLVFRSTVTKALQSEAVPKLLLAPGGIYYSGNFVVDFDGRPPGIAGIRREDARAAEVVREETGIDLPMIYLDTSVAILRDGIES
ncbi:MAG: hypothetical protein ACMVY4_08525 [Minwuia sp.]|uniref:hypothetical protein n=1 Tax=Minwuia sp. TaxID=2493630 RepID=UPI003A8881FE